MNERKTIQIEYNTEPSIDIEYFSRSR